MGRKLSTEEQSEHFKYSLGGIQTSLKSLMAVPWFHGEMTQQCVQKIIDRCDSLPSHEAIEMLDGLRQLMNFLSARVSDVNVLVKIVTDSKSCLPPIRYDVRMSGVLQEMLSS